MYKKIIITFIILVFFGGFIFNQGYFTEQSKTPFKIALKTSLNNDLKTKTNSYLNPYLIYLYANDVHHILLLN